MSQKVQAAREAADQKITSQVKTLNSALNTVKDLNDRILKLKQNNKDTSTLEDQRQKKIDEIADIIPIREVPKKNGTVSLVSLGGATLLATKPAKILFEPSVVITADMSLKNGLLSGLKINGTDIALRISTIFSAPAAATATVDSPNARDLEIAEKPATSASMTLEIAHIEALSEALETLLPVEISFWVLLKSILMDLRFCSATIALLLVKILDIAIPYLAAFTFEPL